MQSPVRTTHIILAFIVSAAVFLDYWAYSAQYYREPGVYTDVLFGTAPAPNQYRVGAVRAASFIARHAHLGLRHGMTILDGLSAAIAVYLLYSLLRRSTLYNSATNEVRWFGSAAFVILVQFYLLWITWYQRPETLPTAAIVALFLWLLTGRSTPRTALSSTATAASLLLLAALQGIVRADVIVALNLGLLLLCFTKFGSESSLSRSAMIATGLLGIVIGGGIQFYMMRIAYPHATYGSTPVFQLVLNLTDHLRIVPFIIFLLPWAWTILALVRRRIAPHSPSAALLVGSIIFLMLWCVLGKIDEVRIFLPFALALAPLTAQVAMQQASRPTHETMPS